MIFELIVCKRVMGFLMENKILGLCQHTYQRGRSTQTAIFTFVQEILCALENGELSLGLFLDLSKSFETLDHCILLEKLERSGIRGPALKWFHTYQGESRWLY